LNFMYQLGGKAFDDIYSDLMDVSKSVGTGNYHSDVAKRWQNPGNVTDVPRLTSGLDKDFNQRHSYWLVDASYLGLTNARLGYTIPSAVTKKWQMEMVNFSITGNNLFMLTQRQGYYPSGTWTGTSNDFQYMPLSSVLFGVKVTF